MADDRCPRCGALYSMVGRIHNCRPKSYVTLPAPPAVTFEQVDEALDTMDAQPVKPAKVRKSKAPKPVEQDKPKFDRNAYQRDYMRKYRKKKKGDGSGK